LAPQYAKAADEEANEEAAAIAEKDGRRVEIVTEETEERAGQRKRNQDQRIVVLHQAGRQSGYRREETSTHCEAVYTIDEVEGIATGCEPEQGEGDSHPRGQCLPPDSVYLDASPDGQAARSQLTEQFLKGIQSDEVIEEAYGENERRGWQKLQNRW
jgi:hypothetical protein